MTEPAETKSCRTCYGQMDARARRCPHCGQWNTKWAFLYSPPFLTASAYVFGIAFFGLFAVKCLGFSAARDFADYKDQLVVSESRMVFGEDEWGPTCSVVGQVRNNSRFTWEHVEIDAMFLDEAGKLVDVASASAFGEHILPGGERGFKAETRAALPPEQYASYKVHVRWARDPGRW